MLLGRAIRLRRLRTGGACARVAPAPGRAISPASRPGVETTVAPSATTPSAREKDAVQRIEIAAPARRRGRRERNKENRRAVQAVPHAKIPTGSVVSRVRGGQKSTLGRLAAGAR